LEGYSAYARRVLQQTEAKSDKFQTPCSSNMSTQGPKRRGKSQSGTLHHRHAQPGRSIIAALASDHTDINYRIFILLFTGLSHCGCVHGRSTASAALLALSLLAACSRSTCSNIYQQPSWDSSTCLHGCLHLVFGLFIYPDGRNEVKVAFVLGRLW
jgi:hypothetical protein